MSKVLAENVYTFRTTGNDDYTSRVEAEADPETNILLITDENKLTGEKSLIVMARKRILTLGLIFPHLKLGEPTLVEWLDRVSELEENGDTSDFVTLLVDGQDEDIEEAAKNIEQQARHIANIISGRVFQVTVQTF